MWFEPVACRISFLKYSAVFEGVLKEIAGNGVESMGSPGVATGYPRGCQPTAFERAMQL